MLTYPKSIMRVRRMPMHLSSGHVTLMPRKNLNLNNVNENDPLGVEQKKIVKKTFTMNKL